MVVSNNFYSNLRKVQGNQPSTLTTRKPAESQGDFGQILNDKINQTAELKFSKHAEMRLQSRNIQLSGEQKEKISAAVSKAEAKGVKDSLVLMDNLAFVVNVKSKTVITAAASSDLKENVFTNIDGAVVV